MAKIEIKKVENKKDLTRFIDLLTSSLKNVHFVIN